MFLFAVSKIPPSMDSSAWPDEGKSPFFVSWFVMKFVLCAYLLSILVLSSSMDSSNLQDISSFFHGLFGSLVLFSNYVIHISIMWKAT